MTTIAYKNGIVACDNRLTQSGGDILPESLPKVWISKTHPAIYAGCGAVNQFFGAGVLLDQMENLPWDNPFWQPNDNFDLDEATVMVVTHDSRIYFFEGKFWYPVMAPFCAMGSGGVAARAAMLAGASAREAVEIACQLDAGSGLPVHETSVSSIGAPMPKPSKKKKRA